MDFFLNILQLWIFLDEVNTNNLIYLEITLRNSRHCKICEVDKVWFIWEYVGWIWTPPCLPLLWWCCKDQSLLNRSLSSGGGNFSSSESEAKRHETHLWRSPNFDCSRRDWSIQTQKLSPPRRSGTSQTSWPTLLGCRALKEEEEGEEKQRHKHKGLQEVSFVLPASELQPVMEVTMCGRRIAGGRTKSRLMWKWEGEKRPFILCWILLFGVWKRGFRCVSGT